MISVLIVFQSLFVLTIGQSCGNLPMYARCSTNPDCGCLPFSSVDGQSGICAYLHLNPSKLRTCNTNNYYCDQLNTMCVHHPSLSMSRLLCYPTGMTSLDMCPPFVQNLTTQPSTTTPIPLAELCANVSWTKQGVTVAGSTYIGTALNQLRNPTSFVLDSKTNTLYIADYGNARMVTWELGAKNGSLVFGGNGVGNRTDQLGWISGMVQDPNDGSLIICDGTNRRIVRWSQHSNTSEILINNLYCGSLALDNQGLLYISEYDDHRVSRWILGKNLTHDGIVAGNNGKGNRLDQLHNPLGLFVDHKQDIYIADYSNNRVVKWIKDAKEGIVSRELHYPRTVRVTQSGNIYSIDGYYNRIVRWTPEDTTTGTIIIGEKQYTLSQPHDIAFDENGNVFVLNYGIILLIMIGTLRVILSILLCLSVFLTIQLYYFELIWPPLTPGNFLMALILFIVRIILFIVLFTTSNAKTIFFFVIIATTIILLIFINEIRYLYVFMDNSREIFYQLMKTYLYVKEPDDLSLYTAYNTIKQNSIIKMTFISLILIIYWIYVIVCHREQKQKNQTIIVPIVNDQRVLYPSSTSLNYPSNTSVYNPYTVNPAYQDVTQNIK
ncbi:unnamed protein product [Adineta steineri]|uniref:NHL repeat containing protein n=1 Tax=Adineta steineri TaxID=433720 RepID=A0A819CQ34_9BILA|nr:unnamed protein product [Adineta steineri]